MEVVESVRGEDVVGNGVFADAELQRDPASEVRDARVQLATGGDTAQADVRGRLQAVAVQVGRIAHRHPVPLVLGQPVHAVGHPERSEQVLGDIVKVILARGAGDHFAEQAESEVRVLEGMVGRQHDLGLGQGREHFVPGGKLVGRPCRQRGFGDQSGPVCQQSQQRDLVPFSGNFPGLGELGQVPFQRIFQGQLATIPQLQHRRGGQRLGDRGNAMEGVLVCGFAGGQVTGAKSLEPGQFLVEDQADTQSGQTLVDDQLLEFGFDVRQDVVVK